MRAACLFAAFALVAAPAAASEPVRSGQIWTGTLGDQAITACFDEQYASGGLYYIDAALTPIRLEPLEKAASQVFTEVGGPEDTIGATWSMDSRADDRLTGEWQQGERTLPIRLSSVPVEPPEYGSACETAAFLDPLLAGGETTATRAVFGGTAFTALTYQGPKRAGFDDFQVTSLALDPVRPGDAAINRALAQALPDGTAGHPMGQCVGWSMDGGGTGYLEEQLVPMLIAPGWLGIRRSGSGYCGGAHPNHFSGFAVYDRDTGAEVDPTTWFASGALSFYEWEPAAGEPRLVSGTSEALRDRLLAGFPAREDLAECVDFMRDGTSWDIGLTREGLVFVPQLPHVIFACTEEVVLPWKAARPFLSEEGRAVMNSLRSPRSTSAR